MDSLDVVCGGEIPQKHIKTVLYRCANYPFRKFFGKNGENKRHNKSDSYFEEKQSIEEKRQRFLETRNVSEVRCDVSGDVFPNEVGNASCRKRMQVQRSLSLPDVVLCSSSVLDVPIYNVLNSTENIKFPQTDYSELSRAEMCVNVENKKMEFEGPVYPKVNKKYTKSVVFRRSDDEYVNNVSEKGKMGRIQLKKKDSSSGYCSGDYNGSLSIDMLQPSLETTGEKQVKAECFNTPYLSIFQQNSNGSLYINEDIVQQLINYNVEYSPRTLLSESRSPLSQFCYDKLMEEVHIDRSVSNELLQHSNREAIQKIEGRLKNELYLNEFERCMLSKSDPDCEKVFSFSDSTSPRNTGKKSDSLELALKQEEILSLKEPRSAELFGDGGFQEDPQLVKYVERASRCTDDRCDDKLCKQVKSGINDLRRFIDDRTHPKSNYHCQLLYALKSHSDRCDDLCKVPWCRILSQIVDWSVAKAIMEISEYESSLTDCEPLINCILIKPSYRSKYGKSSLIEGVHWFSLMPLNKQRNVVIAEETQDQKTRWIVKKTNLNDYEQQFCVYEKLKEFSSPYIVEHYWAAEYRSYLLTCCQCKYGGPLSYLLHDIKPEDRKISQWMHQIISGVQHLHKYDIIFLKWASKNIMINEKRCLQICDLSSCVLSTHRQCDYREVKRSLPSTIVPPEIDDIVPEITEKTDSWGCGCLLYEFCTSYPVFHERRHEHPDKICEHILSATMPILPEMFTILQPILNVCWIKYAEKRGSLQEIIEMFVENDKC